MMQILECTKNFDICGGVTPSTVRVSIENSKATVILSRCAIFSPATAEFRFDCWGSHYLATRHSIGRTSAPQKIPTPPSA
jgi:hypothetical protein